MEIINNTRSDSKPPSPALKDDGTLYALRMHFDNDAHIAFADTEAELLSILIPNYLTLDDDARLAERVRYGRQLRTTIAAEILSELNGAELEPIILKMLLSTVPSGEVWGSDKTTITLWEESIPLVLLAQDYMPYTDVIAPMSSLGYAINVANIIWLDALNDESLLESLDITGIVTVSRAHASIFTTDDSAATV